MGHTPSYIVSLYCLVSLLLGISLHCLALPGLAITWHCLVVTDDPATTWVTIRLTVLYPTHARNESQGTETRCLWQGYILDYNYKGTAPLGPSRSQMPCWIQVLCIWSESTSSSCQGFLEMQSMGRMIESVQCSNIPDRPLCRSASGPRLAETGQQLMLRDTRRHCTPCRTVLQGISIGHQKTLLNNVPVEPKDTAVPVTYWSKGTAQGSRISSFLSLFGTLWNTWALKKNLIRMDRLKMTSLFLSLRGCNAKCTLYNPVYLNILNILRDRITPKPTYISTANIVFELRVDGEKQSSISSVLSLWHLYLVP